jgi:CRP-like cAMP-binding protein
MKTVVDKFEYIISALDAKSQELYHATIRTESFSKNKMLLKGGSICVYTYVVLEGCIRKYYLKNGMEITSEFIFPGEMAVSVSSFLQQQPSNEFIQAIEPTEVMMIPYSLFELMQNNNSEIVKTNFNLLAEYTLWLERRLHHIQLHSAKERYQMLLQTQPQRVQKIPLTYIASYLGITLETLSRIRSQII